MTTTLDPTVLTPQQRAAIAADERLGGGNVLQAAIAANPHPELPFIYPVRPLAGTDGQPLHALSLGDLDALAQSWSVWYLEQGVKPRDRVAVYVEDSFRYSLHYYALSQIGAIGMMINSNAPGATANALCRQVTPVGIYSDHERLARLRDAEGSVLGDIGWTQCSEELPAPPAGVLPDDQRYRHAPDDPVSLLHSSGTTGWPKPVIQTHRSSVAGPKWRIATDTIPPGARVLTSLPQSHLGAIAFSSYALLCGMPLIPLYDPTGEELLAAVQEHRPTSVMSFSHAYADLTALDIPDGAVDSVDLWISVGDAVHEPHIRALLGRRSPDLPLATFYDRLGSSEMGWGVLLHTSTIESGPKGRCAGRATGVADVRILRKDGSEAAPDELGFLAAKGPTITVGYWNDSDTAYRSKLAGYWMTGDIAYRDADGLFYQVDRAVDAIETRTGTGYSVLMEEILLGNVPQIADCGVAAGRWDGETVAVALVRTIPGADDVEALLRAANAALRAAGHVEVAVLEVARSDAEYPVGVTGKVLKRQLRERFADLATYIAEGEDRLLAARDPSGVAAG